LYLVQVVEMVSATLPPRETELVESVGYVLQAAPV